MAILWLRRVNICIQAQVRQAQTPYEGHWYINVDQQVAPTTICVVVCLIPVTLPFLVQHWLPLELPSLLTLPSCSTHPPNQYSKGESAKKHFFLHSFLTRGSNSVARRAALLLPRALHWQSKKKKKLNSPAWIKMAPKCLKIPPKKTQIGTNIFQNLSTVSTVPWNSPANRTKLAQNMSKHIKMCPKRLNMSQNVSIWGQNTPKWITRSPKLP